MFRANITSQIVQESPVWGLQGTGGPTTIPNLWTPSSRQHDLLSKFLRDVTDQSQLTKAVVNVALQALSSMSGPLDQLPTLQVRSDHSRL
jgi:hypothetical protein